MTNHSTPFHHTSSGGVLLSVRDLSVSFHPRRGDPSTAVRSLSFDLLTGGSLAIVGESGSGKTVSMRGILGLLPETARVSGSAWFDGQDLISLSDEQLRAVRGQKIAMVFQNAMDALNPTRTLKRQLTEHLLWHQVCSRAEATQRAIAALDRVGIPDPARRIGMYPFQLSGGMRQRAMIAMAIVAGPTLLIADEPTTAVDVTLQRQVLDLMADLRGDGLTLIMITHDLGVARYMCDDLVVMRDGAVVETAPMGDFARGASEPYSQELLAAAIDVELPAGDPRPDGESDPTPPAPPPANGEALLEANSLVKIFHGRGGDVRAVDDVSISIATGETVAVVGESGSGKSTLARLSLWLIDPTEGEVRFDGKNMLTLKGARMRHVRRHVQMVFQNPYGSLLPHMSAVANVAEPLLVHRIGTTTERRRQAIELLELVGIDAERADFYPRQFSGGQQQRIAIARALALEPRLLVCDEPTSALDVSIQAQILQLLQDLQQRLNLAMLFVTHNLAVAQQLADRIVVMAQGHIVETAPTVDLFTRPQHPYTQALLAAVLPVHGDLAPWQPDNTVDVTTGQLTETTPGHWVRTTQATNGQIKTQQQEELE